MPYQPTTNFVDKNGIDLGKKLVTKDYLLEVYGEVVESSAETGLTVSPGLWTWGRNYRGSLGINSGVSDARSTPVTTFLGGTNWKQVSFGQECGAAIKTDGTLWTWGDNFFYGQLGHNDNTSRFTPTKVGTATNWKQVVFNRFHVLAIKTDGTLWTWGRNDYGQLGHNDTTQRNTPTQLGTATNWKSIFDGLGLYHSSAIKTDGTLWTWGRNNYGQLGTNDTTQRNIPVTTFLGGTTWKHISCGREHTTAIKTDGTLWTWGRNNYGQLGINNTTQKNTPVTTFLGGTNWKFSASGSYHTGAIKTDGTLWTWGYNYDGQLGNNNRAQKNTPVTTFFGTNDWIQISCGANYTTSIKVDGTLWNWGANTNRQLGINNTSTRIVTPITTFAGGTNWKQVSTGYRHTGAIRSVNEI